ncbi:Tat pathway signal sequence domain protein, partial [Acinetobacter sp. ATCC 27244]
MTQLTPYHEDQELDNNTSTNVHFRDILEQHINRRSLITKTASGAVALTLASTLTGCNDNDNKSNNNNGGTNPPIDPNKKPEKLNFTTVPKNLNDIVTVPEGYEAHVLYALGDSINPTYAEWDDNNIPSGPSFQFRSGDCHDGMSYFGLNTATGRYDEQQSNDGLLVLNHEYINPTFLHPKGPTKVDGRRPEDEVIREVNAHGVSIIHVKKDTKTQKVELVKNSVYNRRITGSTLMEFAGPAAGNALLATKFSPSGVQTRGTHNNCGNGYTPWGTYLTTEENFIGYFTRSVTDDAARRPEEIVALQRYGLKQGASSRYGWETAQGQVESQDLYDRWNADVKAANAGQDYRNAPNTFGWMVEIDPFDSRQAPVKRTALGRFAHEDCRTSRVIEGQNLAFYMGDDSRGEYIYKFVSDAKWDPKDINGGYRAGDKYMNSGKFYVAKFNADGTGQWLELSYG